MLGDYLDGEAVAFLRYTDVPNEEALIVVNKSKQRFQQRLLVPYTFFEPRLWFKDLLTPDSRLRFTMASFQLDVPPESASIFVPDDGYRLPNDSPGKTYLYFKPRMIGPNWPPLTTATNNRSNQNAR